jgi:hypothetical protein
LTAVDVNILRLNFPPQFALGEYTLTFNANITDVFGRPLGAPYTNGFVIAPLLISGTVMDTNSLALSNVTLQPSGGLPAVTSDSEGVYVVAVNPTWSGSIAPTNSDLAFVPAARYFTNVTTDLLYQNFVSATPEVMRIATAATSTNLTLTMFGLSQMRYQAYLSTNLVNWAPYGSPIMGSNAPITIALPTDVRSNAFLQFKLSN